MAGQPNDGRPLNWFQRWFRRVPMSRPGAWLFARVGHPIDLWTMRLTGGRTSLGAWLTALPVVVLTTTGARSGRTRKVPLVAVPDREIVVLIASRWGGARNPGWYYNLKANPNCRLERKGCTVGYRAREVGGEERERYWRRATELYPGYENYLRRAGRPIPVMALMPIQQEAPAEVSASTVRREREPE